MRMLYSKGIMSTGLLTISTREVRILSLELTQKDTIICLHYLELSH